MQARTPALHQGPTSQAVHNIPHDLRAAAGIALSAAMGAACWLALLTVASCLWRAL